MPCPARSRVLPARRVRRLDEADLAGRPDRRAVNPEQCVVGVDRLQVEPQTGEDVGHPPHELEEWRVGGTDEHRTGLGPIDQLVDISGNVARELLEGVEEDVELEGRR